MADPVETLDLEFDDAPSRRPGVAVVVALAGTLAVAATVAYYYGVTPPDTPIFGYEPTPLDWLWLAATWVVTVFTLAPVVRNPAGAWRLLSRLRRHPVGAVGGVVTLAVVVTGTVGPVLLPEQDVDLLIRNQPPLFTSVSADLLVSCVAGAVGDRCWGSLQYPLGTTERGVGVTRSIVAGARAFVKVSLTGVALAAPLGTLVGVVSGYAGGTTDRVLSGIAESVKTIPALLVFLAWRWLEGSGTPFMLVVCFGLFSWGTVAGVVRERTLSEASKDYVRGAELAGASRLTVIRRHLLPNVARAAASTSLARVPIFLTVEATLAFLEFGAPASPILSMPPSYQSWGETIGGELPMLQLYWWRVVLPAAALLGTTAAVTVFADALQRILDPRGE
ncbi:ABC transporter permease [Halobaculum sp. MBLA0143]|uniref:ABC transporter permease n=1 Tax=Halobaculum sp. MBLA0143 TaxID=3079933 RepID=UPI003523126E